MARESPRPPRPTPARMPLMVAGTVGAIVVGALAVVWWSQRGTAEQGDSTRAAPHGQISRAAGIAR